MKTGNKELEAYEGIIQNLLVLNEKAVETKAEETEAIRAILRTLSALRDCVCDPDEFLASNPPACVTSVTNQYKQDTLEIETIWCNQDACLSFLRAYW